MPQSSEQEGCCGRTLIFSTRWTTVGVCVIGAILTGYALFLVARGGGISIVSGTILAIGLIDLIAAALVAWRGLHSRNCLSAFFWGFGFICLCEIVASVLFFLPSTRESILNEIPQGETRTLMADNATAVGIGLLVAMAVQAVALAFAYCRMNQLQDRVSDDDVSGRDEGRKGLLSHGSGAATANASLSERKAAAAERYRGKRAATYDKYRRGEDDLIKR